MVLGLAVVGSFMQVTGLGECPQTETGIPGCYISFLMSMTVLAAFLIKKRIAMRPVK